MSTNFDPRPLHQQLKDKLSDRISGGVYAIGERVPSCSELQDEFGVSLITVRRAVTDLIKEGVLRGVQGKGTFVVRKSSMPSVPLKGLLAFVHGYEQDNPFFQSIFKPADEEVRKAGYALVFASSRENIGEEESLLFELRRHDIKGALLAPYGGGKGAQHQHNISSINDSGFPLVLVDQPLGDAALDLVGSDNFDLGVQGTEYLISLGHRRIAFVMGPDLQSNRERLCGYQHALTGAGIELDDSLVAHGSLSLPSVLCGRHAAEKLVSYKNPPTAIFCSMDDIALGVMRYMQESGISVPGSISILGVDNLPFCTYLTPSLCTVGQNTSEIGRQAAQLLLRRLQGDTSSPQRIAAKGILFRRESCAGFSEGNRDVNFAQSEKNYEEESGGETVLAESAGCKGRSKGFTLIEMLVVIAIIGILAALLMPSLDKAIKTAQQTVCLNNLKQISFAQSMYAADYDGMIWYHVNYTGILVDTWAEAISGGRYYPQTKYINRDEVFCCPSSTVTEYKWNPYIYGMYSANTDGWYNAKGYSFKYAKVLASYTSFFYRQNAIPSPSRFAMLGDTLCTSHPSPSNVGKPFYQWSPTGFLEGAGIYMIHNGLANISFADGHAASMDSFALRETQTGVKCTVGSDGNRITVP